MEKAISSENLPEILEDIDSRVIDNDILRDAQGKDAQSEIIAQKVVPKQPEAALTYKFEGSLGSPYSHPQTLGIQAVTDSKNDIVNFAIEFFNRLGEMRDGDVLQVEVRCIRKEPKNGE